MTTLYCACCGRPFIRTSTRGPAPRYCSQDCRLQMAVRRRAWSARDGTGRAAFARTPATANGRSGRVLLDLS